MSMHCVILSASFGSASRRILNGQLTVAAFGVLTHPVPSRAAMSLQPIPRGPSVHQSRLLYDIHARRETCSRALCFGRNIEIHRRRSEAFLFRKVIVLRLIASLRLRKCGQTSLGSPNASLQTSRSCLRRPNQCWTLSGFPARTRLTRARGEGL